MDRLRAEDARSLREIRQEAFTKTLGIVRQMCDASIRDNSRRGHGKVNFEVPVTLFGRDAFDRKRMGRALAEQLFEDGYDVSGTCSNLRIVWAEDSDHVDFKVPHGVPQIILPFSPAYNSRITPGNKKKNEIKISSK